MGQQEGRGKLYPYGWRGSGHMANGVGVELVSTLTGYLVIKRKRDYHERERAVYHHLILTSTPRAYSCATAACASHYKYGGYERYSQYHPWHWSLTCHGPRPRRGRGDGEAGRGTRSQY